MFPCPNHAIDPRHHPRPLPRHRQDRRRRHGEVYRARDTKLDPDVALKVLPQAFTDDPDRLARFEREAKVLASLNHPNIGHIYGLEEAEGQKALVLELVEGPTLADRITQGLPRSSSPRTGLRCSESVLAWISLSA